MGYRLWDALECARNCKWVELSYLLNNDSPYWAACRCSQSRLRRRHLRHGVTKNLLRIRPIDIQTDGTDQPHVLDAVEVLS